MRRTLACLAAAAALLAVGCANDGRSLGSPSDNSRSIVKDTTADTDDELVDDAFVDDEFTSDDFTGDEFLEDTLPGDGELDSLLDEGGITMTAPFDPDAEIPVQYTCDGLNASPEITWGDLPEGTVEVAIQVIDLEAEDYTHWVIAGLKPEAGGIKQGEIPLGAIQALNSKGTIGYTGPCPPKGTTHDYLFEVDAMDSRITLPNGTDADTMLQAVGAATIESASITGFVTR